MTLERRIKECIRAASHLCSSKFRLRVPTLDVVISDEPFLARAEQITKDYAVIILNLGIGERLREGIFHEVAEISCLNTFDPSPKKDLSCCLWLSFPNSYLLYLTDENERVTLCTIASQYEEKERRLIVQMGPEVIKKLLLRSRAHCLGTFTSMRYGLGADLEAMRKEIIGHLSCELIGYLRAVGSLLWMDYVPRTPDKRESIGFFRSEEANPLITMLAPLIHVGACFLLMTLIRERPIENAERELIQILASEMPSPAEVEAYRWLVGLTREVEVLSVLSDYLYPKIKITEVRFNPYLLYFLKH